MMFRHTLFMQLRLMLRQRTFAFCFAVNMLYVSVTFIYYALIQRGQEISTILSPSAVFALNSNMEFYPVFINAVPFLTVLPFAMSYMTDRMNETMPVIQNRTGIRNYYISKAITCFIGGFMAFCIPLVINILINRLIFPQSGITAFGDLFDRNYDGTVAGNAMVETVQQGILFRRLFLYSADLYNLFFAFIFSVSMGILSVFNLAVSFMLRRYRILLFLPVYLIVIIFNTLDSLLQNRTPFVSYKIMAYISVDSYFGKSGVFIGAFFSVIVVFSTVMIIRQIKKDQL